MINCCVDDFGDRKVHSPSIACTSVSIHAVYLCTFYCKV